MKKIFLNIALIALAYQAKAANIELVLELKKFEPINGQHYEGWNIVNGKALSTGRFNFNKNSEIFEVNADGNPIKKIGEKGVAKFSVDKSHLNSTLFVLTIEPNGDTDEKPSTVHVIGGNYNNNLNADLNISHNSSLGTNFSNVTGGFILAAPTGGEFNKGVWFIDPSIGEGALNLPKLPTGWVYEGWIVNTTNGKKYSTGIFNSTSGADSDGAGYLAGPLKLSFPPVPGQDIVKSHVVLNDGIHAVVISVEPYPDFDPAPYAIKPLMAHILTTSPGMTLIPLNNTSENAPSGVAYLH